MEAARRHPCLPTAAVVVRADEPVAPAHPLEVRATSGLAPELALEPDAGAGSVEVGRLALHHAQCAPKESALHSLHAGGAPLVRTPIRRDNGN